MGVVALGAIYLGHMHPFLFFSLSFAKGQKRSSTPIDILIRMEGWVLVVYKCGFMLDQEGLVQD